MTRVSHSLGAVRVRCAQRPVNWIALGKQRSRALSCVTLRYEGPRALALVGGGENLACADRGGVTRRAGNEKFSGWERRAIRVRVEVAP